MDLEIEYAKLVLPYFLVSEDIDLEIHSVSVDWEPATVSWNYPWETAGGEYRAFPKGVLRMQSGYPEGKDYFIDVTENLREIQNGAENHGLIVLPTAEYGQAFGQEIVSFLESAGPLVIRVYSARGM